LDEHVIAERLGRLGGPAAGALAHPYLRELAVARMRAEIELSNSYRHHHNRRLRCRSLVYGGREDTVIPADLLGGWRELLADCEVRLVPGNHYFPYEDVSGFLDHMLSDAVLR